MTKLIALLLLAFTLAAPGAFASVRAMPTQDRTAKTQLGGTAMRAKPPVLLAACRYPNGRFC